MIKIVKGAVQAEGSEVEIIADFAVLRRSIEGSSELKELWEKSLEARDFIAKETVTSEPKEEDMCDCPDCRLRREIRKEIEEENKLNKKEGK